MNWSNEWAKPATLVAPSPTSNPWDAKGQDEVLMEWQRLQKTLAEAKEAEMEFRKYVVKRAFPAPTEGTNTVELGNGYKLKAGIKYNYTLDPDNNKVEDCLEELSKLGNDGPFIADRLVSWKPNFLLTEYRKIEEEADKGSDTAKKQMSVISKMLTISDAAPTLTIVEPKAKK